MSPDITPAAAANPAVAVPMAAGTPLRVILASQSPRRRELLTLVGIAHEVRPADIDESLLPGETAVPHCERLARTKAERLAGEFPDAIVVGADTIVVVDGDILGKPRDAADAAIMLRRLSDRSHTVFTAVAVVHNGETRTAVEEVLVTFLPLSESTIAAYIATGEPMDKAGAYGIQGFGATNIARIEGDYFSVMGLPVARTVELMRSLGVHYAYGPVTS